MNNLNCPKCDCTRLQYEENFGYWECFDCGHVWALDVDEPDYEESDDDSEKDCVFCLCTGWVGLHGADECPVCGGCGYI